MKVLLIRHGSRLRDERIADPCLPLSPQGEEQARLIADFLVRSQLAPSVFLSSHNEHAIQTAGLLAKKVDPGKSAQLLALGSLTPHSPWETFEEMIDEACERQWDLRTRDVVAIVGHEPRLSQFLTRMTGTRTRPFGKPDLVCITAETLSDLLKGKGKIEFRFPVVAHQEDQLRAKVTSKMTVSTFLAGFAFTALLELLVKGEGVNQRYYKTMSLVGEVSLLLALVLFVAAVYMYDRLAMPEGFWTSQDRETTRVWRGKGFEKDQSENGTLYAHMIWVWTRVFTPAVFFLLIGLVAVVLRTANCWLIVASLFVLGGGARYYHKHRPRLGID